MRTIAIVGGGLAGLAAANALAAQGFAVEVFERASTLAEIGAGINISPQAVKALRAIGLGPKLAAVANTHPGDDPAAALANFRRIRVPRVHGVQRRSFANARIKHMHDRQAQRAILARDDKADPMEWIVGYDPVASWDKPTFVPVIE